MASRKADQLFSIFNLSTATADGTNVKYLDGRSLDKGFLQIRWTAGSGGGTLSLTVAGTTRIYGDETQAAASDTGDIFIDVSTSLLGAATVTGDYFVIDDIGSFGCMPWLKFTAVVANSDASTVLNVEYYNKEVQ